LSRLVCKKPEKLAKNPKIRPFYRVFAFGIPQNHLKNAVTPVKTGIQNV
jgi:hypothetical protein